MKSFLKVLQIILTLSSLQLVNLYVYSNASVASEQKEAEALYRKATKALKAGEHKEAAKLFGDVTYKYPYYKFSAKAQIMEIYSYYMVQDYDNALPTIENFLKLHPASAYIPYVYYIKGLSYFEQIDIPQRDQSVTEDAKRAFSELISRFPNSEYAKDAQMKLVLIEDHLAGQEMFVGRYYLNNGNMVAAINRFKMVVQSYPHTAHIQEALYRLAEAYAFLGVMPEARKYSSILAKKYPKSQWYRDSLDVVGRPRIDLSL